MSSQVNDEGIDRLLGQLERVETIDFNPLMFEWRTILELDNERRVLDGVDGFDNDLIEVTYRPAPNVGSRKPVDFSPRYNNNLTTQAYRTLDGPPLAPRGIESRLYTQFRTRPQEQQTGPEWYVLGEWEDFLSLTDTEILPYHADGEQHNANLPIRDVLHVTPTALGKARQALVDFVNRFLKGI
jgi:hypothetical protein